MEKFCRVGQATDDIMAHAYCIFGTKARIQTRTKLTFNTLTYCFSTTTIVNAKCLNVYVVRTLRVLLQT